MDIPDLYKLQAIKIAKTLQDYLNSPTKLNSFLKEHIKDEEFEYIELDIFLAYKILSEDNIIERDYKWGATRLILFIEYLFENNVLKKLIPQCKFKTNIKEDSKLSIQILCFESKPESIAELNEIESKLQICKLSETLKKEVQRTIKIPENTFTTEERHSNLTFYPRYGIPWSDIEDQLLLRCVLETEDLLFLSHLFGRKPSALRSRLEKFNIIIDFAHKPRKYDIKKSNNNHFKQDQNTGFH